MENARMLAAMVSRAPVRAVIPENTATHMSVRSYLTQLCGYLEKILIIDRSTKHHEIMVSLSLFFTGTPSFGKFFYNSREICIFNR